MSTMVAGMSRIQRNQRLMQARSQLRPYQVSAPVDVKTIAEDLGLRVWEMSVLPPNISGKLFLDPHNDGKFSIGVNAAEGFRRKRFTIAHEIAHYMLHRDLIQNGILEDNELYRSGLSTEEEVDANKLAADILMPYHLIRQFTVGGIDNVHELAERFQVSVPAMQIRLGIPIY